MHGTDNILSEKKKEIRELQLEEICFYTGMEEQSKWLFKVQRGLFTFVQYSLNILYRALGSQMNQTPCAFWSSVWEDFQSQEINTVSWERAPLRPQWACGGGAATEWVSERGSVMSYVLFIRALSVPHK